MSAAPSLDKETIFCRHYAQTGDAIAAVITAGIEDLGDPTIRYAKTVIAQQLLERPEIQAAVKAFRLVESTREPPEVTHKTIAASMDEVYARAFKLDDMKACISARQLQANVLGLLEQKIRITSHKTVDEMTTAELAAIAFRGRVVDVTPTKAPNGTTEDTDTGGSGSGDNP